MRKNYYNIVKEIYRALPHTADYNIGIALHVLGKSITESTLKSWKSRLRKEGIDIPDQRKR